MKKCMFDTVIFNRVVEHKIPVELFTEYVDVYATHVQQDEIDKTPDHQKRADLKRVFTNLDTEKVPTESAVWDESRWDESKWSGDDDLCKRIGAALDRCKKKKNNIRDALIAETAIKNTFTLVTDDRCLKEEVLKLGGGCLSWRELLAFCRSKSN